MSGCSSKIQRWTCGHGSKYTVRPRSQEHETVSEHLLIGYPIWEALRSQHLLPWHVKRSQAIGVIEDDFGSSESTLASLALWFAKGLLQITPHQWYKVLQEFITYLRDSMREMIPEYVCACFQHWKGCSPEHSNCHGYPPSWVGSCKNSQWLWGKMQGLCWVDAPMNACMKWMNAERMSVLVWTDLKWFELKLHEMKQFDMKWLELSWHELSSTDMNWKDMKEQKRRGTQSMNGLNRMTGRN